jgi:outer membrane protein assembly factor BamA
MLFLTETFAQDYSLKLTSKNKAETSILDNIKYRKKHKDTITLNYEISKVADYLKNKGYFLNTFDSLKKINNAFIAHFSLHKKTEKAIIKVASDAVLLFNTIEFKNNSFSLSVHELQATLTSISKKLDTQGKSFSKVQLKNIKINNDTLFADLEINPSKKRIINRITVKGYDYFPKSYLKNYFDIKSNTVFNQQKITKISDLSKNLPFIKEIKPPEVLFTRDSTQVFLYFKKRTNNSIDGIISFATKENGDLLFNGNIDLKLNNILNTGEKFDLFWNSIGDERQEFKLATEIPYLFNSKISPELSFSLYKQDSTFLNTKFDSRLFYSINSKIKLALTYNSESSENLEEILSDNLETFNNYFLGFQFKYSVPKNDFFFNDTFNFEINPTFGERKTNTNSSNQFKIETTISYLWDLNFRNSIYIKNKTGYLNSDSFLDNELFRIGGANSIRGFDEQSIFTNNYTFFNIEYRFLTSQKSYLYSITDFGFLESRSKKENILGLGIGYLFTTNSSQIKLSTVVGKNSSQSFNLNNSKLIISWVSFF